MESITKRRGFLWMTAMRLTHWNDIRKASWIVVQLGLN